MQAISVATKLWDVLQINSRTGFGGVFIDVGKFNGIKFTVESLQKSFGLVWAGDVGA